MSTDSNRTRIADRITIYTRGKNKIYVADFWQHNMYRKVSLRTTNKKVAVERATKLAAEILEGSYQPTPRDVDLQETIRQYLQAL